MTSGVGARGEVAGNNWQPRANEVICLALNRSQRLVAEEANDDRSPP